MSYCGVQLIENRYELNNETENTFKMTGKIKKKKPLIVLYSIKLAKNHLSISSAPYKVS